MLRPPQLRAHTRWLEVTVAAARKHFPVQGQSAFDQLGTNVRAIRKMACSDQPVMATLASQFHCDHLPFADLDQLPLGFLTEGPVQFWCIDTRKADFDALDYDRVPVNDVTLAGQPPGLGENRQAVNWVF